MDPDKGNIFLIFLRTMNKTHSTKARTLGAPIEAKLKTTLSGLRVGMASLTLP